MTLCERNASNKEKIFLRLFPLTSRGTAQGASNEIASVQWAFAVLLNPIIVGYKKRKPSKARPYKRKRSAVSKRTHPSSMGSHPVES
ncbi:hypothetical protein DLM76_10090 [Leptospira yasudae]|nr:hypothetical protein DLM76_10090 [Leptospira yasudae]